MRGDRRLGPAAAPPAGPAPRRPGRAAPRRGPGAGARRTGARGFGSWQDLRQPAASGGALRASWTNGESPYAVRVTLRRERREAHEIGEQDADQAALGDGWDGSSNGGCGGSGGSGGSEGCAGPAVVAVAAAEFRVGSLHHDYALALLTLEVPPELEPKFAADVRRTVPLVLRLQRLGGVPLLAGLVRALTRAAHDPSS